MRINGELSVMIAKDAGVDEKGHPLKAETVWAVPVPCHVEALSDDLTARVGETVARQTSYQIMVEIQPSALRDADTGARLYTTAGGKWILADDSKLLAAGVRSLVGEAQQVVSLPKMRRAKVWRRGQLLGEMTVKSVILIETQNRLQITV